jgi:hypothetical protein
MDEALVITRPLSPAERAALPEAWRRLTTSRPPEFVFREPPEQPLRRASDHPRTEDPSAMPTLPLPRIDAWTDLAFGRNGRTGLLLAPVVTPPLAARRRPRRDNADVALADHALRLVGRIAGPAAVSVVTFILVAAWLAPRAVAQ